MKVFLALRWYFCYYFDELFQLKTLVAIFQRKKNIWPPEVNSEYHLSVEYHLRVTLEQAFLLRSNEVFVLDTPLVFGQKGT